MAKVSSDVVIVGVAETSVGNDPGMGPVQIQARAVTLALRDAGLRIRDVDGLVNQDPYTTGNSMTDKMKGRFVAGSNFLPKPYTPEQ